MAADLSYSQSGERQAAFAVGACTEDSVSLHSTELESQNSVSELDSEEAFSRCNSQPSISDLCTTEDDDSVCDDDDELAEVFDAEETLIIFDWDDTLLPSHWLRAQGLECDVAISESQRAQLETLSLYVEATLLAAQRLGVVLLVTNAEHGWVEYSCRRWLPSLTSTVAGLRVLSARSAFEAQGVASPVAWKKFAFESEIGAFCSRSGRSQRQNLISIGDSSHEREALIFATQELRGSCVKSVKFAERPDLDQLVREHELIGGCLGHIVQHGGNLDLCIQ